MKWKIAACVGVIGVALAVFWPRGTASPHGQRPKGGPPTTVSLATSVYAVAGATPEPDRPEAAADALRKAQAYYNDHVGRIWQLLSVDYPQAVAKRKANANLPAVREFFKGYPRALEKADPLENLKKTVDQSFAQLSKEDKDQLKPLVQTRGALKEIEFYQNLLADPTAVGTTTVGEALRESLFSPEGFDTARASLARIEGEWLHDEAAATRVKALRSGAELMDYLQSSRARYQEHQARVDGEFPLTAEQGAVFDREVQVMTAATLSHEYDLAVFSEEWRLEKTFLQFRKEMSELLAKLPEEDSPEKREILTGLSDVYMRVKQLDEEAATPRAPVRW